LKARLRTAFSRGVLLLLLLPGCKREHLENPAGRDARLQKDSTHYVEARRGVVVSVSGPASDIGRATLQRGGNAVDAAIATAFALAVAYPPAGNLAGGGFMVVHPPPTGGAPTAFDYRECAPAAARSNMFSLDDSQFTHQSVAVPGTIRGLALAHQRLGTRPWRELILPAISVAQDGFLLDSNLADSMNVTLAAAPEKAEFQRVFGKPAGGLWKAGDRLFQPDLAKTLQLLADLGPDAFYKGPISEGFLSEMRRGGGIITGNDLAAYQAIERQPLSTKYHGYDIYVPPPPSSGGTCLLEELNMLGTFDFKTWGRWSPTTMHVMAEAMRRASYDRARYLGDPAFVKIPEKLIQRAYGEKLAKTIDLNRATPSSAFVPDAAPAVEEESTTQFSIIDGQGMAVANTYTLERRWGSRIVVKDMGFLLNNDMRAFNLFPGQAGVSETNATSPHTLANTLAPGKRPLSSMTPTIIARDGRVRIVTGSPGSQAIPHTVLGILVSVIDFDVSPQTAVWAPRFSHQWMPDQITFETPELYPEAMASLRKLGHIVIRTGPPPQGDAHTIFVTTNSFLGIADWRINGKASGF
jgi:gamma-glutamyltranspeptidase/glutathione hydrolase